MARQFLIISFGGALLAACAPIPEDQITTRQRTLEVERSPDFDLENPGTLAGEPAGVLDLGPYALGCTDQGMSITEITEAGYVSTEWPETEESAESELGVQCNNLDWWGSSVAVSADDRVRLYKVYQPGDEPDWWEQRGQAGPLGWYRDIITSDYGDLGEVSSTTYNAVMDQGYIATCCDRRDVLMQNLDGDDWYKLQLVPDGEDPPERLSLATGTVDGYEYLLGAGGDTIYALALNGGPDLDLSGVVAWMEDARRQGEVDSGDISQLRLLPGEELVWGLSEGAITYDLENDAEGTYLQNSFFGSLRAFDMRRLDEKLLFFVYSEDGLNGFSTQ